MNKKLIIALIVAIAIIAIGAFVLLGNINNVVTYENTLNVTLPENFQTTEDESGNITEAFPEDKKYVLLLTEDNSVTASNINSNWTYIKDASPILADNMSVKDYTIGNNKYYEMEVTGQNLIKEMFQQDAYKARVIDVVFPNTEKVYTIVFATNDTSVDLNNADIQSIINSSATKN